MNKQATITWLVMLAAGAAAYYYMPAQAIVLSIVGNGAIALFYIMVMLFLMGAGYALIFIYKFLAALPTNDEPLLALAKQCATDVANIGVYEGPINL